MGGGSPPSKHSTCFVVKLICFLSCQPRTYGSIRTGISQCPMSRAHSTTYYESQPALSGTARLPNRNAWDPHVLSPPSGTRLPESENFNDLRPYIHGTYHTGAAEPICLPTWPTRVVLSAAFGPHSGYTAGQLSAGSATMDTQGPHLKKEYLRYIHTQYHMRKDRVP